MNRNSITIHISHYPVAKFWFTTFGKLVRDMRFSSDDKFWIFSWSLDLLYLFFLLFQILGFSYMLEFYGFIFEYTSNKRRWLTGEIPELKEDVFFSLGVEIFPIHMFEDRQILIKRFPEVLLKV